jgi:hypothetical protein
MIFVLRKLSVTKHDVLKLTCKSIHVSAGVAKKFQLKKISLIVGFTYRGLTVN